MALETVVFPHWSYEFGLQLEEKAAFQEVLYENWDDSSSSSMTQNVKEILWDHNYYNNNYNNYSSSPDENVCTIDDQSSSLLGMVTKMEISQPPPAAAATTTTTGRRKRRRSNKTCKNREEVENQRMTHIAVERNRRKQMNEYLAVLRSLMPSSYVQRGDQASIIGGAINFVKELEQHLQTLEAHKKTQPSENGSSSSSTSSSSSSSPFADFFAFPQYSTNASLSPLSGTTIPENRWAVADIEVTMVESHANLKILSRKRRPKQLLNMVAGFQNLRLTILHLNVTTTSDRMVLYSISVKIEDGCQLNTVDDIAAAVNQMLRQIQEEVLCDHQLIKP